MVHFTLNLLFISLAIVITGFILTIISQHEKGKVIPNYKRIKLIDRITTIIVILIFILMPCAIFLTFFTIAIASH